MKEKEKESINIQSQQEMDRFKKIKMQEIIEITNSWTSKYRMIEEKYEELKIAYNSTTEEFKVLQQTLVNINLEKEQALTYLESKLWQEHNAHLAIVEKGLEDKIKILENAKESLNSKNADLINEIKQINKKHDSELLKYEKEKISLRQEIADLQKELSLSSSRADKLDNELAIAVGITEVKKYLNINKLGEGYRKQNFARRMW